MQSSDIGDIVRKEKTYRFWPGKFRDYVFLGAFLTTVIVGGNAILNSARPETEAEIVVEDAKKRKQRNYIERIFYRGGKAKDAAYDLIFGSNESAQPSKQNDGYLTNNK